MVKDRKFVGRKFIGQNNPKKLPASALIVYALATTSLLHQPLLKLQHCRDGVKIGLDDHLLSVRMLLIFADVFRKTENVYTLFFAELFSTHSQLFQTRNQEGGRSPP